MDLVKATIRPEFLNRIDEIIMFTPLSKNEIREIVFLQFRLLSELLSKNNIQIEATEYAIEYLTELGYDPQYGARPLKRVIQRKILNELSKLILAGKILPDHKIVVDMFDNTFVFRNKNSKNSK
jgi:ATP-dependent Clp protease ATP-binding subunit ClpB